MNVSWYEGSDGLGADFAASLSGTTKDELYRVCAKEDRNEVDGRGLNLDGRIDRDRIGGLDTVAKERRGVKVRISDMDCTTPLAFILLTAMSMKGNDTQIPEMMY